MVNMTVDKRILMLDKFIEKRGSRRSNLIEVLQRAQEIFGYLGKDTLAHISDFLRLPPSQVYGAATFYNFFRLVEPGQHIVTPCLGTACYVKGANDIVSAIENEFGVERGGSTADGKLSLFVTRCIGACAMAPTVVIDGKVLGQATGEKVIERLHELLGGDEDQAR